jgi:hypothetical protein
MKNPRIGHISYGNKEPTQNRKSNRQRGGANPYGYLSLLDCSFVQRCSGDYGGELSSKGVLRKKGALRNTKIKRAPSIQTSREHLGSHMNSTSRYRMSPGPTNHVPMEYSLLTFG